MINALSLISATCLDLFSAFISVECPINHTTTNVINMTYKPALHCDRFLLLTTNNLFHKCGLLKNKFLFWYCTIINHSPCMFSYIYVFWNHALKHRHSVAYRFENWAAYNYVNNGKLNVKQQQQQVHTTHKHTHICT